VKGVCVVSGDCRIAVDCDQQETKGDKSRQKTVEHSIFRKKKTVNKEIKKRKDNKPLTISSESEVDRCWRAVARARISSLTSPGPINLKRTAPTESQQNRTKRWSKRTSKNNNRQSENGAEKRRNTTVQKKGRQTSDNTAFSAIFGFGTAGFAKNNIFGLNEFVRFVERHLKEDKRTEKQKKTEKSRKPATKAIENIENELERVLKARRSTTSMHR
jgi:hypothetical protein